MTSPHPDRMSPPPFHVPVGTTKPQLNVVGLIGIIVAAIALGLSFIPYAGLFGLLPGGLALILGVIGLIVALTTKRYEWFRPTLALVIGTVACLVGVYQLRRTATAVSQAITLPGPTPTNQTVVRASGDGPPGDDAWVGTGPSRAASAKYAVQQRNLRVFVKRSVWKSGSFVPPTPFLQKGGMPAVNGSYLQIDMEFAHVGQAMSPAIDLDEMKVQFKAGSTLESVYPQGDQTPVPTTIYSSIAPGDRTVRTYYLTAPSANTPVLVEVWPRPNSDEPLRLSISPDQFVK